MPAIRLAFLILLTLPSALLATLTLPSVLSDHMVIQAGAPIPIWGWSAPGEKITATIASQTRTAIADSTGKWSLQLSPIAGTSTPQTLTITNGNSTETKTIRDILVGEVWLCAGQSNMAMQLDGKRGTIDHGTVENADAIIAAANHPGIRMFVHDTLYSIYNTDTPPSTPQADRPGKWIVCSPETAPRFTAIGYFVAAALNRELQTPVGILNLAIGGTPIEAWTSLPAMQNTPALQALLAFWQRQLNGYDPIAQKKFADAEKQIWLKQRAQARASKTPEPSAPPKSIFKNLAVNQPAGLFNSIIYPVAPFAARGVLWYQGERNATGAFTQLYGQQLRTLISDWRARWHSNLYFIWVQLPALQKTTAAPVQDKGWGTYVRDEMRRALDTPNTGMAITIDLKRALNHGHPANKLDYANRMIPLILHDVYKKQLPETTGPLYQSHKISGNQLILAFTHAAGLKTTDRKAPRYFALCGPDKIWHHAIASINPDNTLTLTSEKVQTPVAARYAWLSNPDKPNLVNSSNLPASPFRTDTFPPQQ